MRVRLYSKNANPLVDPPLLHKSPQYVDALVASGEARYLEGGRSAQLLCWHSRSDDIRREMRGGFGDWCINDVSILPHGQRLAITTRQLKT